MSLSSLRFCFVKSSVLLSLSCSVKSSALLSLSLLESSFQLNILHDENEISLGFFFPALRRNSFYCFLKTTFNTSCLGIATFSLSLSLIDLCFHEWEHPKSKIIQARKRKKIINQSAEQIESRMLKTSVTQTRRWTERPWHATRKWERDGAAHPSDNNYNPNTKLPSQLFCLKRPQRNVIYSIKTTSWTIGRQILHDYFLSLLTHTHLVHLFQPPLNSQILSMANPEFFRKGYRESPARNSKHVFLVISHISSRFPSSFWVFRAVSAKQHLTVVPLHSKHFNTFKWVCALPFLFSLPSSLSPRVPCWQFFTC